MAARRLTRACGGLRNVDDKQLIFDFVMFDSSSYTRSIRVAVREMIGREIPKQTVDDFLRERCDRGRSSVHLVSSGVRALL